MPIRPLDMRSDASGPAGERARARPDSMVSSICGDDFDAAMLAVGAP